MSDRATRNNSPQQASKRPRVAAESDEKHNKDKAKNNALKARRSTAKLVASDAHAEIDTGVHSDLRDIKWTLMVAPALTPRKEFGAKMLESNKLVVHVVGVNYANQKVPLPKDDPNNEDEEERFENKLKVTWLGSLGYLGEGALHLGTEDAVRQWQEQDLSAKAADGEPMFIEEMVDIKKRAHSKWNLAKGVFQNLDSLAPRVNQKHSRRECC